MDMLSDIKKFLQGLWVQKNGYNITVITYSKAAFITVQKNCTSFMFTNIGDDIAFVNEMIIYPGVVGTRLGDSRAIGAHKNDVYQGNIVLKFQGTGANPLVEIVQVAYS